MFKIIKMSTASEYYYLRQVNYYLGGKSRKKAKRKRRPGRPGDGDDPDNDSEPDDIPFGLADPYTINTPGEPPGRWWGTGAAALGLTGMVREEEYHRVFRGFHPYTNEPLVQNAGKRKRCAGWEACLTVPKDVSVILSQMLTEDRDGLHTVNWNATEATFRLIEQKFAFSRVGKSGCRRVPVGLVVPMFEHVSARPVAYYSPDPNLHIHAQPLNLGVDKQGETRAIDPLPIFRNQKMLTAFYRAKLAAGLRARFGLITEATRSGFRIRGVPRGLVQAYSKRHRQILAYLAEHGQSGGKAAALAALATRGRKDPLISRQELFEGWRRENAAAGFDDRHVARLLRHGPRKPKGNIKQVIKAAVAALTQQKNHFTKKDLLLTTLSILPEFGLDPEPVFNEVDTFLQHDPNIVPLAGARDNRRYTTKQILTEERRMLAALDRLNQRPGVALSDRQLDRQLRKRPTLRPDQRQLVQHLTQYKSALRLGLGWAGTGKTYALKTCVDGWKRAGYRVLGVAPTGEAATVLAEEIGIECHTVTKLLGDFRLPLSAALVHHVRQFIRAANRKRTWAFRQPRPVRITKKTILLVDESGMIGTRHMRMLAELVAKGGGVLSMIGDPGQLPAVESTPPLQALTRRYPSAALTHIQRQKTAWARRAAKAFAEGNVREALQLFAEKHSITVRESVEEAIQQACLDWTAEGLLTPHRAIILANTNDISHTANTICQEHRLRAGTVDAGCSIRITDEQKETVYESSAYLYDRVLFTRNSRGRHGYGVNNGSLGTVTAISPFTPEMTVLLDHGRSVRVNVQKFPHVRLAYALTTYKAQGASIPKILAIVGGELQNLPASYVQATRAVEDTQFYTTRDLLQPDFTDLTKSPLVKQMSRRPDLRLASEFLRPSPSSQQPTKSPIPPSRSGSPESPAREQSTAQVSEHGSPSSQPDPQYDRARPHHQHEPLRSDKPSSDTDKNTPLVDPDSRNPTQLLPSASCPDVLLHLQSRKPRIRKSRSASAQEYRQDSPPTHADQRCSSSSNGNRQQSEAHLPPVKYPPQPFQPPPQFSPEQAELERERREDARRQARDRIRQLLLLRVKERLQEPQTVDQQPTHSVADQVVQQLLTRFHEVEETTQEQLTRTAPSNDDPMFLHPGVQHYEVTPAEADWIQQQYGLQFSDDDSPTFSSEPFAAQAADLALPQSAAPGYGKRVRTVYIPPCARCGGTECGKFGSILHVTDQ
ncbi:MAG: MobF family relaxase [Pirellulaceae bacterium]